MILICGMEHLGLKLYKVCLNDDPGLTWIYFTTRSYLAAIIHIWGKLLLTLYEYKADNEVIINFHVNMIK